MKYYYWDSTTYAEYIVIELIYKDEDFVMPTLVISYYPGYSKVSISIYKNILNIELPFNKVRAKNRSAKQHNWYYVPGPINGRNTKSNLKLHINNIKRDINDYLKDHITILTDSQLNFI